MQICLFSNFNNPILVYIGFRNSKADIMGNSMAGGDEKSQADANSPKLLIRLGSGPSFIVSVRSNIWHPRSGVRLVRNGLMLGPAQANCGVSYRRLFRNYLVGRLISELREEQKGCEYEYSDDHSGPEQIRK